ncbi:FMN-binding negative transcriptional regulator [Hahella sp. HN01]|uniref:FMN-binding negative transcriptional regulator n=1 Tax=Hahella sp. HN01 TaxID=2847262 RepID=UPI001C1EDDD5|nr:FMN-binding negative transcriptional regulator [Hahella sp. HN01]MBU6951689.1 FMN-binding negative transcriptional regulator [Hahella sp. HN01]
MYMPASFKVEDRSAMLDFIDRWSFGVLMTLKAGVLEVNQVPFILDRQNNRLYGHLARQNDQWKELDGADETRVLFQGPHAYVSPDWYESTGMVPTWNFMSVEARGRSELLPPERLPWLLEQLSDKHEAAFANPWKMNKVPPARLEAMMKAIVGFSVDIETLNGKFKLSQNRNPQDRAGVIAGLSTQPDENSRVIAQQMQLLQDS